jgi:hypothetical protein
MLENARSVFVEKLGTCSRNVAYAAATATATQAKSQLIVALEARFAGSPENMPATFRLVWQDCAFGLMLQLDFEVSGNKLGLCLF